MATKLGLSVLFIYLCSLLSPSLSSNTFDAPSPISPQTHYGGFPFYSLMNDDGFPSWVKESDRKLLKEVSSRTPDLVVAKDGSANYRTINEAVKAAGKANHKGRFVIRIKRGVYEENVDIGANLNNIMLVGDGLKKTIITGNRNYVNGVKTYETGTVRVFGFGFIARGITFQNTAGPDKQQAVAFMSTADQTVLYQCGFEGYQDTLYAHSNKQFYKECSIYGTVDIIAGNAAAVFQNCNIYARKPMDNQYITITAQGREQSKQNTGFVIQNSRVTAAPELKQAKNKFKAYLGRPWKQYSRTVFMKTYLDSLVDPAGWVEWTGDFGLNTLYYGEYKNTGPGASTARRKKWPGCKVLTDSEASKFTVANFIAGNQWLPNTGVPFVSGL